ncbi:YhgE/Pip domain-containing protein [Microbacterium oleivorans]|uniref:ABC-2 type transporter transmembrane domain-containing protein n=1 Tax=Microbacterium oleivorans TaxID=273677 RepID=A0A177K6W0_9MICO|nr:YhgE/Pip domain-containing protein [Microbacterium oleivorans]OAH49142.1 hypothetical protein AYL44_14185 [Microbacterium oleivorans]
MTLPFERAQTRRPVSWLTLLGVLLLPAVIGGILVAALYNPTERLDAMNTAIVNNDEPVEVNGQTTPLGRLLTAGLVEGSDDLDSNLTWTISNEDDATEGLEDGTYDAIVTIPKNFSAAATSTAPGGTPERATIELTPSPDARIVDDAITNQVTSTAASVLGEQLTTTYLENVFLGFTTLNEQLGKAADGATQLADGATSAADGAAQLADGATTAADGGYSLADGVRQLSSGASGISSGAGALSTGASRLADGVGEWADGARPIAEGTQDLANGLAEAAEQTAAIPAVPSDIVDGLKALTADGEQNREAVTAAVSAISAAAAACDPEISGADLCDSLSRASTQAQAALPGLQATVGDAAQLSKDIDALANFGPTLTEGLQTSAAAAQRLADGMGQLADGADELSGGAGELASGAEQLSSGAEALADGAGTAATGADQLADGVGALATGAGELSTGVGKLADGTGDLAGGLDQAVDGVPFYTDAQAKDLAAVVAEPVVADGTGTSLFGASAVPLLATLALWFGGLASFVVLQAIPRTALSSRRSSAALALRALAPGAAVGALQGVLVAGVVQLAAGYDLGAWALFAAMCVLAGVAFAAVNHALVALLGGIGRWISVLVGVLAVATGIVSTVPGTLLDVAGLLPTAPAYTAMLAALTDAGGGAPAAIALVVWTVLAIAASVLAVTRHRSTSARAVLAQPA